MDGSTRGGNITDSLVSGGFRSAYFIGIGGIGMSALARHCHGTLGWAVAGYDRVCSPLTRALEGEGMAVTYSSAVEDIPLEFRSVASGELLVVYTPAVPGDHPQLEYFRSLGVAVHKRAEVLGWVMNARFGVAVSGSHGKSTTTTLIAHLLDGLGGTMALLGAISVNHGTNYMNSLKPGSREAYCVVEADEYDRSFLQLHPRVSVVTSLAADHLDIYGTAEALREAYHQFASQTHGAGAAVVVHASALPAMADLPVERVSYGLIDGADGERFLGGEAAEKECESEGYFPDYGACRIEHLSSGGCQFELVRSGCAAPLRVELGVPGRHNVENALAAIAVLEHLGYRAEDQLPYLANFRGVERRFQLLHRSDRVILVDDYAHHPEELRVTLRTARALWPDKEILGVFQPHLYSRTAVFMDEFVEVLSGLDRAVLLPIYPAREAPIPGVTSDRLAERLGEHIPARVVEYGGLVEYLREHSSAVVLLLGAGDIGFLAGPVAEMYRSLEG